MYTSSILNLTLFSALQPKAVVWSDHTLSPAARRRKEDIERAEFRYGGPNANFPSQQGPQGRSMIVGGIATNAGQFNDEGPSYLLP